MEDFTTSMPLFLCQFSRFVPYRKILHRECLCIFPGLCGAMEVCTDFMPIQSILHACSWYQYVDRKFAEDYDYVS